MSAAATAATESRESVKKGLTALAKQATAGENEGSAISSEQNLAQLAYALWEQRGCPAGSPEIDWLEAERLLGH